MISSRLDPGEKVVVLIRKHWLIFTLRVVLVFVAALLPLLAYTLAPPISIESLAQVISGTAALFAYLLFVLFLWLLIFIDFTTYFLDIWIVTNRRVIDVQQRTLFSRDTTTLMLEKIQDASVEVRGILATVFNFGTLVIHTAGDNPDIVIHYAADPQNAKDKILECERAASEKRGASDGL
jgi:hypothetical protein